MPATAPRAAQSSSFSALPAAAITLAPSSVASSTAANPTPPRGAEHEHGITGLYLGDAAQRVICGGVRDRERGGVLELDRVGHPGEAGRAHDDALGERTDERRAVDAVAGLHVRDAVPHVGHDAGELAPGHERQRDRHLVLVGDDQHVGEIHGRVVDVDHGLARSRHRIRELLDRHVLGRAVRKDPGCAHAAGRHVNDA